MVEKTGTHYINQVTKFNIISGVVWVSCRCFDKCTAPLWYFFPKNHNPNPIIKKKKADKPSLGDILQDT